MLFIRETRLFVCKISHEKADCCSFLSRIKVGLILLIQLYSQR